jgi:hypothetical protein
MRDAGTMRWDAGRGPLDCRVAALLAMTTGGVAGEVGSVLLFGCVPQRCHCEPGRAWQSGLLTFMSLRGRSRRELTWQSSLRRYAGCQGDAVGGGGDAVGCRTRSAGLPRRCAPRNDNAKTWGMLKRSLDCRVATLLAMTKGRTGMGDAQWFRWIAASG